MDKAEVGQQRDVASGLARLEEEGFGVEDVEDGTVGQLDGLKGRLLGEDLVGVGVEERVAAEQRLAKRPLDGRLEFLPRRGRETG